MSSGSCLTSKLYDKIIKNAIKISRDYPLSSRSTFEKFQNLLKGTVARDFRPSVFSSINPPQGPDSRPKAVLLMVSYSPRKSTSKIDSAQ
jgi:hypothetical protein